MLYQNTSPHPSGQAPPSVHRCQAFGRPQANRPRTFRGRDRVFVLTSIAVLMAHGVPAREAEAIAIELTDRLGPERSARPGR
jgi:hypothetical protein